MSAASATTDRRTGSELMRATARYAKEDRATSRFHVTTGFGALAITLTATIVMETTWIRTLLSVLGALLLVRCFILYHDFMHGSMLGGSRVAAAWFRMYGMLTLNPPRIWNDTHDYHHAHNGGVAGSQIGAFPVVTIEQWRHMSRRRRFYYRVTRSPVTIAAAYLTVFLYGMCLGPFLRDPRRYADSGVAFLAHLGLCVAAHVVGGLDVLIFTVVLPIAIASAVGAYIFYVQHNFPSVMIRERRDWNYIAAALESSVYIKMGALARWFLGNIGYHHVHHLNPRIPFYRLPEAMRCIPELSDPPQITLRARDIMTSFRLKLWDPAANRLVGFPARSDQGPEAL